MSFLFPNEDDEDFGPISNSSNLAAIFQDANPSESNSKPLVYTAPKQPIVLKSPLTISQGVIAAAAVTCYKLLNDKYEPLTGKMGLALLGETDTVFRLILYQNKEKPITSVTITPSFSFNSQPDNFCTFNDDNRQNWAILFDSKETTNKFVSEIDQIKIKLSSGTARQEVAMKEENVADKVDGSIVKYEVPVVKESSSKTMLISRIAKLGQPILPPGESRVAEDSDSEQVVQSSPEPELDSTRAKSRKIRPAPPSKPIMQRSYDNIALPPLNQYSQVQQAFPMMQYVPSPFMGATSMGASHFDTLLSETRTHNSEIRMHLCRLTDKIDLILQKGGMPGNHSSEDDIQKHTLINNMLALQTQSVDQTSKLDCILELVHSNTCKADKSPKTSESISLQTENDDILVQSLSEKVDQLTKSIEELTARDEKSNRIVEELREENAQLKTAVVNVASYSGEIGHLEDENAKLLDLLRESREREELLLRQEREQQEKLEYYETECAAAEGRLLQVQSIADEKNQHNLELQQKINKTERELSQSKDLANTLRLQLAAEDKKAEPEEEIIGTKVKAIMNKAYKEILRSFEPDQTYTLPSIKPVISTVVRDVTLAFLSNDSDAAKSNPGTAFKNPAKEDKIESKSVNVSVPLVITEEPPQESQNATKQIGDEHIGEQHDNNRATRDVKRKERSVSLMETVEETGQENHSKSAEDERKERSVSLLETLHSSLAAASLQSDQAWRPDPPPPPLLDDFNNEEDD